MWINGLKQSTLASSDRGLQFGDGCFTTAAVRQGKIVLLESHIQRLIENDTCRTNVIQVMLVCRILPCQ